MSESRNFIYCNIHDIIMSLKKTGKNDKYYYECLTCRKNKNYISKGYWSE